MEIFYEKSIPHTATTLTEGQFKYLKKVMQNVYMDGFLTDLIDDNKNAYIDNIRKTENRVKSSMNEDYEPFEISDELIDMLLEKCNVDFLYELNVVGESVVRRYHNESISLDSNDVKELLDEGSNLEEFLNNGRETKNHFGFTLNDDVMDCGEDLEDEEDDTIETTNPNTTIRMYLPEVSVFAVPTKVELSVVN